MRLRGIAQVRDRVALQAVRPALQDDELRLELFHMRQHPRPDLVKSRIVRPRSHWKIELRALRCTLPDLIGRTRPWIQVTTILVHVGKYHPGIMLERIEHPTTVAR